MAAPIMYRSPVVLVMVLVWITCFIWSADGAIQEYNLTALPRESQAPNCSDCRLTITDPTVNGSINLKFVKLEINETAYEHNPHNFTFREGCSGTGRLTTLTSSSFQKTPYRPYSSVEFQFQAGCVTLDITSTQGFTIQYSTTNYPAQDIMLVVQDGNNFIRAVDILRVEAFQSVPTPIKENHRPGLNISAVAFHPPTMTLVVAYQDSGVISRYHVTNWNEDLRFVDDIVTGTGDVSTVVINPDSGDLYWSDRENNSISTSKLDGSSQRTILTQLRSPRNLLLDHLGGNLYWIEGYSDSMTIRRAAIDGTKKQTCREEVDPIAFSNQDKKLYWVSAAGNAIGEYSWPVGGECSRSVNGTIDLYDRHSNPMNFVVKDNAMMWSEDAWIRGKTLDDTMVYIFYMGFPVKLLLRSKFDGQPNTDEVVTGRSSQRPVTCPPPSPSPSDTTTDDSDTPPPGEKSTSIFKYVFLATVVGVVLCALTIVVLLFLSLHGREQVTPAGRPPESVPLSRNTSKSDSTETA